jgi:hypothetical protein
LRESGVRRSVLCWCIWQESGISSNREVFLHVIYFVKKLINFMFSIRFTKIML